MGVVEDLRADFQKGAVEGEGEGGGGDGGAEVREC